MKLIVLGFVIIAIPATTYFVVPSLPPLGEIQQRRRPHPEYEQSTVEFTFQTLNDPALEKHRITNVQIVDLDGDALPDVLACDGISHCVLWFRQLPSGKWDVSQLGEDFLVPAHATVVDLDADGDQDVVVSVLGSITPTDETVGRLVWLEQREDGGFETRVLLDDVRRVADAQPGDFDNDGDLDLAVAVFGYARGGVMWLENNGHQQFVEHELFYGPGIIHVPVADLDADGDLDIAAIATQDQEELWAFENLGEGEFKPRLLHYFLNYDIGCAGLVQADIDSDGDIDLVVPAGDNLEYSYTFPQAYHGCYLFENQGEWKFRMQKMSQFGGLYAAAVADVNGDRNQDVVAVSMLSNPSHQPYPSVISLENDGKLGFALRQIAEAPQELVTVACGDINLDGRVDIVAGGLNLYETKSPIALWLSGSTSSSAD